jgi:hypothetical protein
VAQVRAPALERRRLALHPHLEGLPRPLVEGLEDLVQLDGVRYPSGSQGATLRKRIVGLHPRRQLHVALAEQRLLAQDRPGVVGYRRELAVELDRHVSVPVVGERDRLHLAHRYAGDPHVGLHRELRRELLEGNHDAVALGLQRQRPAEGDPQEQRQAEA